MIPNHLSNDPESLCTLTPLMVAEGRIELPSGGYQPPALPLSYSAILVVRGRIELPQYPGLQPGALPTELPHRDPNTV